MEGKASQEVHWLCAQIQVHKTPVNKKKVLSISYADDKISNLNEKETELECCNNFWVTA